METTKLNLLSEDAKKIENILSKYTEAEINTITYMQKRHIVITPENFYIIQKIEEYGNGLLNKINLNNFRKIKYFLDLKDKSIEELKEERRFNIPRDAYIYYDFTICRFIERVLYFINKYEEEDKELFDLYNKFYYQLNNNNPYQGWTSSEGKNIPDLKKMLNSIKLNNLDFKNEKDSKKVNAIIVLIDCNIPVSEKNIQTILAMGEYNSNFSIYRGTVSQYFPIINDFKNYVKRGINKQDVTNVLREITEVYGYHSSGSDRRKFDFNKLNHINCLLSKEQIENNKPMRKNLSFLKKIFK